LRMPKYAGPTGHKYEQQRKLGRNLRKLVGALSADNS
jgi:hypothetical protein